jgi:hypothetical protein
MKNLKTIFLAILVLLAGLASYFVSAPVMDQTQQMHNAVLSLEGGSVGQSFQARRNNLYRLDLFVAGKKVPKGGELTLILSDSPTLSPIIRRAAVPGQRIKNNQYLSFVFPRIRESKNKRFYFRLAPKNFEAEGSYVWLYSSEEVYTSGKGFRDGKEIGGDLQFSSFTRTPLLEAGKIVFLRVSENKPFLLKSAGLYLALAALYLFLSALIMVELWPKSRW